MDRASETVFLRSRLGFVRLAMQNGASIVPVFAFGQGQTYKWYRPDFFRILKRIVHKVSRMMGVAPIAMWGRGFTPLPLRVPLTVVVGKPIVLPQASRPDDDTLRQYLDKYMLELQQLYDRHKVACGYGAVPLRVL